MSPTPTGTLYADRLPAGRDRSRSVPIEVRDLGPDAGPVVQAVFDGLSDRSRHLRFCAPTPRLTGSLLRYLTDLDGVDRHAVVALDRDRPSVVDGSPGLEVGVARFARCRHDRFEADVAVAVIDGYQRCGVGTALVEALAVRAAALGIERLRFDLLTGNSGMRAVADRLGATWGPVPDEPTMARALLTL